MSRICEARIKFYARFEKDSRWLAAIISAELTPGIGLFECWRTEYSIDSFEPAAHVLSWSDLLSSSPGRYPFGLADYASAALRTGL